MVSAGTTFIRWDAVEMKASGPPDADAVCLSGTLPGDHGPRRGLQMDVLAPGAGGKLF